MSDTAQRSIMPVGCTWTEEHRASVLLTMRVGTNAICSPGPCADEALLDRAVAGLHSAPAMATMRRPRLARRRASRSEVWEGFPPEETGEPLSARGAMIAIRLVGGDFGRGLLAEGMDDLGLPLSESAVWVAHRPKAIDEAINADCANSSL